MRHALIENNGELQASVLQSIKSLGLKGPSSGEEQQEQEKESGKKRKQRRALDDSEDERESEEEGSETAGRKLRAVLLPSGVATVQEGRQRRVAELQEEQENKAAKQKRVSFGSSSAAASGSLSRAELEAQAGVPVTTPGQASSIPTEELWRSIDAGWQSFAAYRDSSLDNWARKLAYASGLSAKKTLKLKVMNSDLSSQVQEILKDRQRLLARTRLPLESVSLLGAKMPSTAAAGAAGAAAGGSAPAPPPSAANPLVDEAGLYAEAYDDSELFQRLLRDYAASSSAAAAAGAGASTAAAAGLAAFQKQLKSVKREGVDRKASKGRRMKYTVHPKLVSFTAAAPFVVPPEMALDLDTIIASLFKSV